MNLLYELPTEIKAQDPTIFPCLEILNGELIFRTNMDFPTDVIVNSLRDKFGRCDQNPCSRRRCCEISVRITVPDTHTHIYTDTYAYRMMQIAVLFARQVTRRSLAITTQDEICPCSSPVRCPVACDLTKSVPAWSWTKIAGIYLSLFPSLFLSGQERG